MTTTNYIIVQGEAIAENESGAQRELLRDVVGSVIAYADGAGVLVNRYRYKPYGDILSQTGSGPDPTGLWKGGIGYLAFQLPCAAYWRQGRFISNTDGIFVSSQDENTTMCFAFGNPLRPAATAANPIFFRRHVGGEPSLSTCGTYTNIFWLFIFRPDPDRNGWLIQKVTFDYSKLACCASNLPIRPVGKCGDGSAKYVYFEAWKVVAGKVQNPQINPCGKTWHQLGKNESNDYWEGRFGCSHA